MNKEKMAKPNKFAIKCINKSDIKRVLSPDTRGYEGIYVCTGTLM